MTTLITGASGFIGLALTEALLRRDQSVIGYDLSPTPTMAARIFGTLPGHFQLVIGDACDDTSLLRAMHRFKPRQLVTLAAITANENRERATPKLIFDVNVGGVLATLSAAVECGVKRVLHASSGSVYGTSGNGNDLLDEVRTPLQPEALYGISKQGAEAAALRLANLHGLDLVVGRLGTCFGPWEADTGMRDTLSAPLQALDVAFRGGTAVLPRAGRRDWLYVRDAASGMIELLEHKALPSSIYNIAAGFEWSIADWCKQISKWYPRFSWHIAAPGETANINYYASYDRASMSNRRLRVDTGFIPRFDLAAAAIDFHDWKSIHGAQSTRSSQKNATLC